MVNCYPGLRDWMLRPGDTLRSRPSGASRISHNVCGKSSDLLGVVVASVTRQAPRITRVSNGIKVDGTLDGGRASIAVEIVKYVDCSADFLCLLQTVDDRGIESSTTARVQQAKKPSQTDNHSLGSSVSRQVLDLVHELNLKLAKTNKLTEILENKIETIDKKLGLF
ncbi:hypothetical protein RRG08_029393 [Elysia crispata]|uniref:Uncharacterized protein n=1 Tax=Elysia crispata TaxID=231223 RepID=A0AAE1ECP0_9GAST|nr:hypothetical protein RRG08_029393 [Elysia crispata]